LKVKTAKEWGWVDPNSPIGDYYGYDLTWHHNIPYADLRDSWNYIFALCAPTLLNRLYLLYAGGNGTLTMKDERVIKGKLLTIKEEADEKVKADDTPAACVGRLSDMAFLDKLPEKAHLTRQDDNFIDSFVTWQRWNVVEGPKESVRTDDPGNANFDDFSHVDNTGYMTNRYRSCLDLYRALKGFIATYGTVMTEKGAHRRGGPIAGFEEAVRVAVEASLWMTDRAVVNVQQDYWVPTDWSAEEKRKDKWKAKKPIVSQKEFLWVKRNQRY
jgi:hypothetical protein